MVVVHCTNPTVKYVATYDPLTGKLMYYAGSSDSLDKSLTFLYAYEELGDYDSAGDFSIVFDESSALFPYARILGFRNEAFLTCDSDAIFCADFDDDAGKFRLGRYVEAMRTPVMGDGCRKLFLVVQCVELNCFYGQSLEESCSRSLVGSR